VLVIRAGHFWHCHEDGKHEDEQDISDTVMKMGSMKTSRTFLTLSWRLQVWRQAGHFWHCHEDGKYEAARWSDGSVLWRHGGKDMELVRLTQATSDTFTTSNTKWAINNIYRLICCVSFDFSVLSIYTYFTCALKCEVHVFINLPKDVFWCHVTWIRRRLQLGIGACLKT